MNKHVNTHGTGIVIDGVGILLRGVSGAGKSLLALELLEYAKLRDLDAALVADDRIDLSIDGNELTMHAPVAIAGLIELRGRGIVVRPHVEQARLHLVVDIVDKLVRLVEEDELTTQLEGVKLARCPIPSRGKVDSAHQQLLVLEALRALEIAKSEKST